MYPCINRNARPNNYQLITESRNAESAKPEIKQNFSGIV